MVLKRIQLTALCPFFTLPVLMMGSLNSTPIHPAGCGNSNQQFSSLHSLKLLCGLTEPHCANAITGAALMLLSNIIRT